MRIIHARNMRRVVFRVALLLCLSFVLVRGEAPWGSIAANVGISVPRGSFADTAVGATFTTSDASGGVFRVEPLAAASTACALGGYTYNGVAFQFTRVDTGATTLPFRVDINLNTTMTNMDGMQTFAPYGHGLYACMDTGWTPLHTLGCTNPVDPLSTPTRYLSTSTCRTNLTVALLYDTCNDDIPYTNRNKAVMFLRTCHGCLEGNGYDFRGCACTTNSSDDYDTNGVVISMAIMSVLAFVFICYLRFRLLSADKAHQHTWIMIIVISYAILGAFIIARLFGAYDGRDTTALTSTGFSTLRGFMAMAMAPLFFLQASSSWMSCFASCCPGFKSRDDALGTAAKAIFLVASMATLYAANLCLMMAPAFPAYFAHKNAKSIPTEWIMMVVVAGFFALVQEWMTWSWVYGGYQPWEWSKNHCRWIIYGVLAVYTAVMWGMTGARLPCE